MGNSETHNLGPIRKEERDALDLSRHVTYKQYCRVGILWPYGARKIPSNANEARLEKTFL